MTCPHCGKQTEVVYLCGHIPMERERAISDLGALLSCLDTLRLFGAGTDECEPDIQATYMEKAKTALILAEALGL